MRHVVEAGFCSGTLFFFCLSQIPPAHFYEEYRSWWYQRSGLKVPIWPVSDSGSLLRPRSLPFRLGLPGQLPGWGEPLFPCCALEIFVDALSADILDDLPSSAHGDMLLGAVV